MKKFLPLFFFLTALLILPVFSKVSAKELGEEQSNASEAAQKQISYTLPYPGMLPDSPLYKIKVLRDKIIATLINDPQKKIDFYLLQADKGIQAALMLANKNKIPLAKETALKAEHNMTLLVTEIKKLTNKPEASLFGKLKTASLKHQELLAIMMQKSNGEDKKTFTTVLGFSKSNLDTIDKYSRKNPKIWADWTE